MKSESRATQLMMLIAALLSTAWYASNQLLYSLHFGYQLIMHLLGV